MGDGTKENPYIREDVIRLIKEHDGTPHGLNLSEKIFVQPIDLSNLELNGIILNKTDLSRANFNGSKLDFASLIESKLECATFNPFDSKAASLQKVDLRGADLRDAQFKNANLTESKFQRTFVTVMANNLLLHDERIKYNPASLERADFREANLFRANFTGCNFYRTKLEGAHFCEAEITTGDTHLGEADWGNYFIGEEIVKDYSTAEHRYRHLKAWYDQSGYGNIANKFYYREKEAARKGATRWNDRAMGWVMWAYFGHGLAWKRIFIWVAALWMFSSLLYFFFRTLEPNSIWDCMYYSAVSFTAVGYGAWVKDATGFVKWLGVIETLLGNIMVASILVTFMRKWTH